jgi:hypothetical protein
MKTYEGVGVQIHVFSTSALVRGERSASRLGPGFTPGERAPGADWIGAWVGPRTGMHDVERRKSLPLLGLELQTLTLQPVARRYPQ